MAPAAAAGRALAVSLAALTAPAAPVPAPGDAPPAAAGAPAAGRPSVGIVTLHTADVTSYANSSEAENRRYAARWGYGFHVVDHAIDKQRVPHWSKLHAVQIFLPEYDYVLWIDADAVFFDHSRRIEEVMDVDRSPGSHIWAQDIWPDYPSVQRQELIDTGIALFRNSRWTRQFLAELYHLPDCQQFLNWTEQYCFTVAYRADLLGMRERTSILPTPRVNHHILPAPENPHDLFVLHLAGRSGKARAHHLAQVAAGAARGYRDAREFDSFWNFHRLFAKHKYSGIASISTCLFGMGPRHRAFMDALLFHFPYMGAFTVVRQGAPGLWSAMKATEQVGDRFPERMAHMDVQEYLRGETRDGERFVEGFFCDVFVLGVESWRHLPAVDILGGLARSGLEPSTGGDNNSFGYSPLREAYFALLYDGCDGGGGPEAAAAGAGPPEAAGGARLDADDGDGAALADACDFLGGARRFVEAAAAAPAADAAPRRAAPDASRGPGTALAAEASADVLVSEPALWSVHAPGQTGVVSSLGAVALTRLPRDAFL